MKRLLVVAAAVAAVATLAPVASAHHFCVTAPGIPTFCVPHGDAGR